MTDLQFFNTISHKIETFNPIKDGQVGFYCCGPTVYNFAHIGNFRTFVFSDLVRRFLEFKGFKVTHVMNVTDVDDKIIQRVNAANPKTTLRDYTAKYEKAFFEDFEKLNCRRPTHIPHATAYIPQMLALIGKLMDNGIAYKTPDGSIFFSIRRYMELGGTYGQLVKIDFDEARMGERVKSDEYEKENAADFALWKARVPGDGEIYWDSPWGQGRPGWHIECSAMSSDILNGTFDIHAGGEDLAFPHHEDEIAQSEGACLSKDGSCKPQKFVRYWIHFSHLMVEGKKMSKSLGNFYTLRDLFAKGYTGREIRYLLLSAHYREPLNFTLEGLNAARSALARLDECLAKLKELANGTAGQAPSGALVEQFDKALSDDFNLSASWAVVFDWIRENNRLIAEGKMTPQAAAAALADWQRIDIVLAVSPSEEKIEIPADVLALVEERQAARKAKNFAQSDVLRDAIKAKGWIVKDTPKGPALSKA